MDAAHILILTMYADNAFVGEAFQVGVALYILKQSWSNELPKVAPALLEHIRATQGAHHAMLDQEKRSQTDLGTLHALYQQLGEKARGAKERSDGNVDLPRWVKQCVRRSWGIRIPFTLTQ